MIRAEHIMTDHFIRVGPEVSVGRAIEQMLDEQASMIAIVDSRDRLQGTLPDSVILRAVMDSHLRQDPISLHMLRQFASVDPQAPVDLVLDQFVLHHPGILPVTSNGCIMGVIERMDLLRGVLGTGIDADHSQPDFLNDVVGR